MSNVANMFFNAICENQILVKISESTVLSSSGKNVEDGNETEEEDQVGINV